MTPAPSADREAIETRAILVVEDEFYLAMEIRDTLADVGGRVIGPSADEEAGIALLRDHRPDAAILDINLGSGPSFRLADALQAAGVPFLFLTGYDATTIPSRFDRVERVQKPANMSALLAALRRCLAP